MIGLILSSVMFKMFQIMMEMTINYLSLSLESLEECFNLIMSEDHNRFEFPSLIQV